MKPSSQKTEKTVDENLRKSLLSLVYQAQEELSSGAPVAADDILRTIEEVLLASAEDSVTELNFE